MKVTAFIRKNGADEMARVYFRVRDSGGVDLKAASGLAVRARQWSAERQGYSARARVAGWRRRALDEAVATICARVAAGYRRGVDNRWLRDMVAGALSNAPSEERDGVAGEAVGSTPTPALGLRRNRLSLADAIERYVDGAARAASTRELHHVVAAKVRQYEKSCGHALNVATMTAADLRQLQQWLEGASDRGPSSLNSVACYMRLLRTVARWCVKQGLAASNPFNRYEMPQQMFGDPFFLTLDERDRMMAFDLTGHQPQLALYRDLFALQCMIGCRASDLNSLTAANVVDGAIEYIPQKTRGHNAATVRVPLTAKAQEIIARHRAASGDAASTDQPLMPRFNLSTYNIYIKRVLRATGIDRMVRVLDPRTRQDVARPLCDVATSHTARKTFIGNLYRQVQDPALIASMSGHTEHSRAFARYRNIDDDIKRRLVDQME